jgi:hypothetical protein
MLETCPYMTHVCTFEETPVRQMVGRAGANRRRFATLENIQLGLPGHSLQMVGNREGVNR